VKFFTGALARVVLGTTILLALAAASAREPRQATPQAVAAPAVSSAINARLLATDYRGKLLPAGNTGALPSAATGGGNAVQARSSSRPRRGAASANPGAAGFSPPPRSRPVPKYNLRKMAANRPSPALAARNRHKSQHFALSRGKNNTVRTLRGKLGGGGRHAARGRNFPALGKSFIADNRTLFGLENPEQELEVKREWMDDTGRSHAVFRRLIGGVPVLDEEIAVHGIGSELYFVNARYNNKLAIAAGSEAKLTPDEAWARALEHLSTPPSAVLQPRHPELQMLEQGDAYRYVYEVGLLLNNMIRWKLLVDAGTGDILDARKDIRTQLVEASGTDALGAHRNFTAWREGSTYFLLDPSTPTPDAAYDPLNINNSSGDQILVDARNDPDNQPVYYSTSSSSNAGWDASGVSAFANTRQVYDYYLDTHGRNSIDDSGMNLISIIRCGDPDYCINNAYWNGVNMTYGEGDGSFVSQPGFAACLDVVAHEMTHGVVENTSGLVYRNQSGALNESFADIMGAMVDGDDWLLGEDCVIESPGYIRSLSEPETASQPGHMSGYRHLPDTAAGDWGGVHINSGIPNRAAYLAAEGLSVEGGGTSIGRAKTERIFYRGFTTYLTATAEFVDARAATLRATEDLYGSNSQEQRAIADAWSAVGVTGEEEPSPEPESPIESTEGEDFIVYLYPVDGVNDGSDPELFDLYSQSVPDPFPGYDPSLDIGPLNISQYTYLTTPAPFTSGGELHILYVGLDNNVYLLNPDGSEDLILDDGNNRSVAMSPDFRYLAVTPFDLYDNSIDVYDFETETWSSYPLESPNYSDSGSGLSTALFAESLAFDYTGRKLIYDYLTCIPSPSEDCDPLTAVGYWSIGIVDAGTGRFTFPFPAQSPAIDLGYPRFPNKTSRYFVFDFNDWTDFDTTGLVSSSILIFDTIGDQDFQLVGVPTLEDVGFSTWGVPSFSGDDNHVVFQSWDGTGTLGFRALLENYAWGGEVDIWNDFDVGFPVAHRNGSRTITATLASDKSRVDFGSVPTEQGAARSFTLSNLGNRAIDITAVSVTGDYFTHNLSNKTLPAGESLDVRVDFTAGRVGGSVNELLSIDHNGDNFELAINLAAVITGSDVAIDPLDSNGNGYTDWDEGIVVDSALTVDSSDMRLLRLYTGALGRVPDLGGFDYWRGRIAAGTDFSRMGEEFYWSPEMQIQMDGDGNGTVSNEEFVSHLYLNVLLRAPDEGGFNYWMGRLEAGDNVGAVMASFLNGQEYVDNTLGLLAEFALDNPDLW
jgi:bacillolysin